MRWSGLAGAAVAAGLLAGPAAADADAALTAHRVRVAEHPGFVRVVVDFRGGRLPRFESLATDPDPYGDGRVLVDVRRRGVRATAAPVRAHGLVVAVEPAAGRVRIRVTAPRRRFKYVERTVLHSPERVVLDVYDSRPPGAGAQRPAAPDRCLALRDWTVAPGRIDVAGSARDIFEKQFLLVVRDARGRVLRRTGVLYDETGRWRRTLRYRVARRQPGTLEALDLSEADGALTCLAQVRVTLE